MTSDLWPMSKHEQGKDGKEGFLRVFAFVWMNFQPNYDVLSLELRGEEEGGRRRVFVNECTDFIPQDLKTNFRLMKINFLFFWSFRKNTYVPVSPIYSNHVFMSSVILTYCVWRFYLCVDSGIWLDLSSLTWVLKLIRVRIRNLKFRLRFSCLKVQTAHVSSACGKA